MSLLPPGDTIDGFVTPLPPGEHVRWQGRPEWKSLARHALRGRAILIYFGILACWKAIDASAEPPVVPRVLGALAAVGILAGVAYALTLLLAWLQARATIYAITDRRIVMRVGVVFSSTINIPFRQIETVQGKRFGDGSGDIAMKLGGGERIAYFQLWPHARPWHFNQPQPTLRSIPDMERVGAILREALGGGPMPAPAIASQPAASSAPSASASPLTSTHAAPAPAH